MRVRKEKSSKGASLFLLRGAHSMMVRNSIEKRHHTLFFSSPPKTTARSAVSTDKAPGAVGPYSQAIKTTGAPLLFVSGQVALVPGTKELAAGGVEAQAEQCLKNLGEILREGGASFDSVVKTTVLLADMGDFAAVNGVYAKYFSRDPQPARACFAVKALPLGALVEIEATAVASG
jgi:2-iminobutanoate/2-iminopropanoate deaminase